MHPLCVQVITEINMFLLVCERHSTDNQKESHIQAMAWSLKPTNQSNKGKWNIFFHSHFNLQLLSNGKKILLKIFSSCCFFNIIIIMTITVLHHPHHYQQNQHQHDYLYMHWHIDRMTHNIGKFICFLKKTWKPNGSSKSSSYSCVVSTMRNIIISFPRIDLSPWSFHCVAVDEFVSAPVSAKVAIHTSPNLPLHSDIYLWDVRQA